MPPAFALSQDQTLRFIKTRRPKVTQPDEHRPYSLIKSAQATRPGQTTRSVCSSSKRYINKHPNHPSKRVTKPNYTQTTNRHALSGTTSGRRQRIPSRPYIIVKEQKLGQTAYHLAGGADCLTESTLAAGGKSFTGTAREMQATVPFGEAAFRGPPDARQQLSLQSYDCLPTLLAPLQIPSGKPRDSDAQGGGGRKAGQGTDRIDGGTGLRDIG
jgi:hypothetical protein